MKLKASIEKMDNKSCFACANELHHLAEICPKCGVRQTLAIAANHADFSDKEKWVAFVLSFFLGVFGAHRFYVGRTGSAIAMLLISLTFFGLIISGIWNTVDWIRILVGSFTDAEDKKLRP